MGEIRDGYYYPSVNEITVGFEHETNWARAYEDKYESGAVQLKDEDGSYLSDLGELVIAIDDGYGECRVPLLTEKQMREEGWKTEDGFKWFLGGRGYYSLIVNESFEKEIFISMNGQPDYIFQGSCPTINHLRTIMKLLNIK